MPNRKKNVPEPADAIDALKKPAEPDPIVQEAIDSWAAAGDATQAPAQTDLTNARNAQARLDAADPDFDKQYEKAREKAVGYLVRRRVQGNRTAMVPPNAELHPKLQMWGLPYGGKWLILRWLDIRPRVRQKRDAQGWQYFEGKVWCERLGLIPDANLNERNRIGYMDTELAWAPEEYIFERMQEVSDARGVMVSTATDRLMEHQSRHIPRIEVLEGDDEAVLGELQDRKRYAERRA